MTKQVLIAQPGTAIAAAESMRGIIRAKRQGKAEAERDKDRLKQIEQANKVLDSGE